MGATFSTFMVTTCPLFNMWQVLLLKHLILQNSNPLTLTGANLTKLDITISPHFVPAVVIFVQHWSYNFIRFNCILDEKFCDNT